MHCFKKGGLFHLSGTDPSTSQNLCSYIYVCVRDELRGVRLGLGEEKPPQSWQHQISVYTIYTCNSFVTVITVFPYKVLLNVGWHNPPSVYLSRPLDVFFPFLSHLLTTTSTYVLALHTHTHIHLVLCHFLKAVESAQEKKPGKIENFYTVCFLQYWRSHFSAWDIYFFQTDASSIGMISQNLQAKDENSMQTFGQYSVR